MDKLHCDRLACYFDHVEGTLTKVPLPAHVTPQGMVSHHGRARTLVDVIAADDPRTDAQIIADQVRRSDVDLDALIAEAMGEAA